MKRSPAAAVFLSLLPGLGHVYVGQVGKGFLLLFLFASAIHAADRGAGIVGIFFPAILLYSMIDAHRAAVEVNRILAAGGTLPRSADLGIGRWWGYILIGIGVLFTLENFDLIDFEWLWNLWPLVLIGIGIYLLRRPPAPAVPIPPAADPLHPSETEAAREGLAGEEHGNV